MFLFMFDVRLSYHNKRLLTYLLTYLLIQFCNAAGWTSSLHSSTASNSSSLGTRPYWTNLLIKLTCWWTLLSLLLLYCWWTLVLTVIRGDSGVMHGDSCPGCQLYCRRHCRRSNRSPVQLADCRTTRGWSGRRNKVCKLCCWLGSLQYSLITCAVRLCNSSWFVCKQDYFKSCGWIYVKFFGNVGRPPVSVL